MAVSPVSIVCSVLLGLLCSCQLVYCGLPIVGTAGHSFIIRGVSYPAGLVPSFTAVYVISETDGMDLTVQCAHNVSGISIVQWSVINNDFAPTPSTAPDGDPELFSEGGNTRWSSDGRNLMFTGIGTVIEGIYRCTVGESRFEIRLTFENPYLRTISGDESIMTELVDTLELRAVSRYADPLTRRNIAPPLDILDVVTMTGNMMLPIISANESSNNPYQTIYQVRRPELLVSGTIQLIGMGNATVEYMLSVEDIFGEFPPVTLVNPGDQVVFNCTPTQPQTLVTFSTIEGGPLIPATGSVVWNFTALVQYSGTYSCSAQFETESRVNRFTFLLVYPNDANKVTFYDPENTISLPDGHVFLNSPATEEGISVMCVSRVGTVSVTSENDTITEYYRTRDLFTIGGDTVVVDRGERYVLISIAPTRQSYADNITCHSDGSSETSLIRIVAGEDYVALNGGSPVTIDYGTRFNVSFVFVTLSSGSVLRKDGVAIERPIISDPRNLQIRNYLVDGLSTDVGTYTLTTIPSNEVVEPVSASLTLNLSLPELTVYPQNLTVEEGESFTLNCTSSIPITRSFNSYQWMHPSLIPLPSLNPTTTVISATATAEGSYRCTLLEDERIRVAFASTIVNVITKCPMDYAGGILWPETVEDTSVNRSCQSADSRFSSAVLVTRVCTDGGWADPNFSGCTLVSNEPETFAILSLYFVLFEGTEAMVTANAVELQKDLDDLADFTSYFISSNLEIVPGILTVIEEGVQYVRLRYTLNLNQSANETDSLDFVLSLISEELHCNTPIFLQNDSVILEAMPFEPTRVRRGNTVAFSRSDTCECNPSPLLPRGVGFECLIFFDGVQNVCSGTAASPCSCSLTECQCSSPYVGNGTECTLDTDGDSFPDIVPQTICRDVNTRNSSYCQMDVCPNVPNFPADNSTACRGFPDSVVACVNEVDSDWGIQWPYLPEGETVILPCGVNFTGNASRMCGTAGVWAEPNVTNCSSRIISSLNVRISLLVAENNVDGTLDAVNDLADATEEPLFPQDVESVVDDVSNILTLLENNLGENNNASEVFSVLDNLLLDGNVNSFEVLEEVMEPAGSQVLDNVERYALYLARVIEEDGEDVIVNRTGENIVLRAASLSVDNVEENYVFPEPEEVEGVTLANGSLASISLPQELLNTRGTNGRVNIASLLFRNLGAFLPNDSEVTHPRSLVISSQVNGRGGSGTADATLLANPVNISFSFQAGENETIDISQVQCVFWDFGGNATTTSDSATVRWSSVGLTTVGVAREGDTITVNCSSNHLTSFAVLVDVGGARIDSEALRIVSYIGLAISLACLLLTIIFFLSFGKKLFAAVHNFVHLNLAIALFCGYAVFAFGLEFANHEKIPCNLVTALIQYFLLSAFCWMMCEGIMLYLMLVVVFSTLSKKWWFFFLLGWGIPLIFVVIGLGAVHEEYGVKDSSQDPNDYYHYCWLSSGEGTYAIWTFVAPMIAIIIINTVFLVLVIGSIAKSRTNRQMKVDSRQKKVDAGIKVDIATTVVKASVILLPLLGLTWVFGLFAVNENTAVFAWLFTIFNSLQGLFIFIFHVIRHDRIWSKMKKRYDSYSFTSKSKPTDSTSARSKYLSVGNTSSGVEMKDRTSFVDPVAPSEVKVSLDIGEPTKDEPTKDEMA